VPAAPKPANELQRLNALNALQIMDTGPDQRFQSFVRLASDMFGVPIALVTLLDAERQWFKAAHGTDLRQTERSAAFCAHAILDPDEVMVVEDATEDPRFADNRLVLDDPHIRFYAGAVVRSPGGEPVGTLCLIDRKPRTLDPPARARLAELAGGVSAMLELHRATTSLRHAATHDSLTGVANRALFDQRLELAVHDALSGRPCALILLDLDGFKQINDRFGHITGDLLLREVARRLTRLVRGIDLVARFGGDEFAVLMGDPADRAAGAALAARIEASLAAPMLIENNEIRVTASTGIACCPLDATSETALLHAADQALYGMKRGHDGPMPAPPRGGRARGAIDTGRRMERDLQAALETNALCLHWQPIFNATTLQPVAYEALMRWNRPGVGPVPASVFISVAEASGLIIELDRWAVHQACKAAALWPDHIGVSVNLTSHWFGEAGVADLIHAATARHGLSPRRLSIEITERTGIVSQDIARNQIDALHALGVRIALDDFGTGFSSLAYLHALPIDSLKLDRSFVSVLEAGARARAVARAVIELGHQLGVLVCAEGVETQAQCDWLRENGCDLLQGYLLGRPTATILPHAAAPRTVHARPKNAARA
jgi:diguanylate cyclase (GGDEF)-like protein